MTGTDYEHHGRLTTDRRNAAELLELTAIGNEGEDREAVVRRLMGHESEPYADAEAIQPSSLERWRLRAFEGWSSGPREVGGFR
jgi:hypothetical protein